MLPVSLISIIISTASTVIALIMLFWTRQDMNRRERKDQELFVDSIYEQFQEQNLALLQDDDALEILAHDIGKEKKEVKQDALASVRINQAHRSFQLYQRKYLSIEQWERFKSDIVVLFTRPFIQKRWAEIQKHYQPTFQQFINENILNLSPFSNTELMTLTVIHSTANCDQSSCPTIYQNEDGNYIIQGFKIQSAVKSSQHVPENEDMIELPKEFIQTFLEKHS